MSRRTQALCSFLFALVALLALRPLQPAAAEGRLPPVYVGKVVEVKIPDELDGRDRWVLLTNVSKVSPTLRPCAKEGAARRGPFTAKGTVAAVVADNKVIRVSGDLPKGGDAALLKCVKKAVASMSFNPDVPDYTYELTWTLSAEVAPPPPEKDPLTGELLPSKDFGGY